MRRSTAFTFITLTGLLAVLMFIPLTASADKMSRATMLSYTFAGCHGTDGASPGSIPSIECKSADYLMKVMTEYRDGKRSSTIMGRHVKGYTNDEMQTIAGFYATKCSKK